MSPASAPSRWSISGKKQRTACERYDSTLTLTNVGTADAASYNAVISDTFGSLTSAVAVLTVNLSSPDSFNPGAAIVSALAVQPDGKVLAGFSASAQALRNPARFNPNGTVDLGFNPGITPSSIASLAVQPDGKIVVAGSASVEAVQELRRLLSVWRLRSDGSVDTIFTNNLATNFNGTISSLALQPDGKILLGGSFTIGKPAVTTDIARFNADGTLDTNFSATANGTINCVALQPDGAILVGGGFTTLDGQAHTEALAASTATGRWIPISTRWPTQRSTAWPSSRMAKSWPGAVLVHSMARRSTAWAGLIRTESWMALSTPMSTVSFIRSRCKPMAGFCSPAPSPPSAAWLGLTLAA